jgi:hypothetical protein
MDYVQIFPSYGIHVFPNGLVFDWNPNKAHEIQDNWNGYGDRPAVIIDKDKGIDMGNAIGHVADLRLPANGAIEIGIEWLYGAKEQVLPKLVHKSFVPLFNSKGQFLFICMEDESFFSFPWQHILNVEIPVVGGGW